MTAKSELPSESDFDPTPLGDLDAQCAWKNFGGLSIEEAVEKFRECPLTYQEDFMFMGSKAFAYYFPAIDGYLRSYPDMSECDNDVAWILSQCIQAQFDSSTLADVRHLSERVIDLAIFVCESIEQFDLDDDERQRVIEAWTKLRQHVLSISHISKDDLS